MNTGSPPRLTDAPAGALFGERELAELERHNPDGLTSADIIRLITNRGGRLSEGTFRKYVQLGLLPRSRRVGKKGKHKGSTGIYPTETVRQIVAIKQMMAEGLTIEQIQRSWLKYRGRINGIRTDLRTVLDDMEREIEEPRFAPDERRGLGAEIEAARGYAADLLERLQELERNVAWSPQDSPRAEPDDMDTDTEKQRFF